jgi:hypothetical protein
MTNEELTAIGNRANAATTGPWEGTKNSCVVSKHDACGTVFETGCGCCTEKDLSAEDAAFIAAARVDVPALIAEVQRLRALVESAYMEGATANWDGHGVPAEYFPNDWAKSDARRALEVQP